MISADTPSRADEKKNREDRGAVWFFTYLQAPRQDIGWAILKGSGATDEQVRSIGALYQEYAGKEAELQWKYLEASTKALRVLGSDNPKNEHLERAVDQVKTASLAILENHLGFWERATAILGSRAENFFKASVALVGQIGGSGSYPFYPYLFAPPPEEDGAVLARKVGILPEQLEGLEEVATPLLKEVKPFVEAYTQKIQVLLQMAQAPGAPDWAEIRKISQSMVDVEAKVFRKELEFWREFHTFLDEDQVAPFWTELMKSKWEFYIRASGKKE
ncbi:MAG: hypothetical protein V2G42_03220 [bacterium JZ-2024 1]